MKTIAIDTNNWSQKLLEKFIFFAQTKKIRITVELDQAYS
jgi:hypothetical protein